MTKTQIGLVQASWRMIAAGDKTGSLLYQQLSAILPALAKDISQQQDKSPSRKIVAHLSYIVRKLNKPVTIIHEVEDFSHRHVSTPVHDEAFILAGRSLLDIIATGLGDKWNAHIEHAWLNCYVTLAEAIMNVSGGNTEPIYYC